MTRRPYTSSGAGSLHSVLGVEEAASRETVGTDPHLRRRRVPRWLALFVLAAGAATLLLVAGCWEWTARSSVPSGTIVWQGGYEAGNFGAWIPQSSCTGRSYEPSEVGEGCASVVGEPARYGRYSGRFEVRASDTRSDTERAELYVGVAASGGREGEEWYYGWSTMFPAAGNSAGFSRENSDFNVFTSWHNADGPCGGNVVFGIDALSTPAPRIYFTLAGRDSRKCAQITSRRKYFLPLRYDHWYDFVARIKWSSDPGRGSVEVWVDGEAWVPPLTGATMLDANGAYWKQGFYRAAWDGGTNTVHHDGARRGDSRSAVEQQP